MEKRVDEYLTALVAELRKEIQEIYEQARPLELQLEKAERALAAAKSVKDGSSDSHSFVTEPVVGTISGSEPGTVGASSKYRSLTMKELTEKALKEHFKNGATASQLLDFFSREWGRTDIVRTSLSPQLSRLKRDRRVHLIGKTWVLAQAQPKENEPPEGGSEDGEAATSPNNAEGKTHWAPLRQQS